MAGGRLGAMATAAVWLGLTAVLTLPHSASALYFYVTEGQQRCFIEEVPADTLIVGKYKNPDFVPFGREGFTGVGIKITVQDPAGTILSNKPADTEGRFAFTSVQGGEYVICFATNSSRWFNTPRKMRVDLKLDVGETGIDYTEVAKKEHLSELEVEIRKLNDKVKDITKEQQYQREREENFRDTSESTNSRVQWWSIAQTLFMLAAGLYQIYHLQAFFRYKKVV